MNTNTNEEVKDEATDKGNEAVVTETTETETPVEEKPVVVPVDDLAVEVG